MKTYDYQINCSIGIIKSTTMRNAILKAITKHIKNKTNSPYINENIETLTPKIKRRKT